jgi:AAA ATPase domain
MDEVANPFAPGAGNPPPELAGRSAILDRASIALRRLLAGRHDKSQLLLGLRGVGKTVLLNKIEQLAEGLGAQTVLIEAPESRRLGEQLVPALRRALLRLDNFEAAKAYTRRGMGALRNFASVFRIAMGEVEFYVAPEPGLADSGELSVDLPDLLITVGEAARAANKIAVILVDEVQYLSDEELSAIIVSAHRVSQRQLPLIIFGAGLPQLAGLAGEAKSYAERLFDYPEVGALRGEDARNALAEPVRKAGAKFAPDALDEIVFLTQGYPYFLQEWGYHAWNVAPGPLITKEVAQEATARAIARLDEGFFRVRFDRLTPRERDYMRAMAELGPGPHRSGDIARGLGNEVRQVAPLRGTLIGKGMIYSPAHGDTAFTVPMFDEFLIRSIPEPPPNKRKRRPVD